MQQSKPQRTYTLAPAGTHVARLYQLLEIGTVEDSYNGESKKLRKIRFTFELPDEKKVFKEGEPAKPVVISEEYTFSMGPKANLRKFIENMLGVALQDEEAYAFDPESIVGQTCLITITHKKSKKGNEFARIVTASPLMKNQVAPMAINPVKIVTYEKWDQDFFDKLPDFIKEKMQSSEEYRKRFSGAGSPNSNDDLPF